MKFIYPWETQVEGGRFVCTISTKYLFPLVLCDNGAIGFYRRVKEVVTVLCRLQDDGSLDCYVPREYSAIQWVLKGHKDLYELYMLTKAEPQEFYGLDEEGFFPLPQLVH